MRSWNLICPWNNWFLASHKPPMNYSFWELWKLHPGRKMGTLLSDLYLALVILSHRILKPNSIRHSRSLRINFERINKMQVCQIMSVNKIISALWLTDQLFKSLGKESSHWHRLIESIVVNIQIPIQEDYVIFLSLFQSAFHVTMTRCQYCLQPREFGFCWLLNI